MEKEDSGQEGKKTRGNGGEGEKETVEQEDKETRRKGGKGHKGAKD